MPLHTFEDLEVWKRSCRLAVDVCVETDGWKDYALRDQVRRSAISIASNVAEGAERDSDGDFVRFLRISKGSCGELRTQIYIAQRIHERLGNPLAKSLISLIAETKEISAYVTGPDTVNKATRNYKKTLNHPSAFPLKTEN